jgi:uncharacterized coiled-coil protein SlyX
MSDATPPRTLAGRVDELEIRAEFQARNVEELDTVVRDFADRVLRLERELADLRGLLETLGRPMRAPTEIE